MFHFVLLADNDTQPQVFHSEAVKDLVMSESQADEHCVIKPSTKRAAEQVHFIQSLSFYNCTDSSFLPVMLN